MEWKLVTLILGAIASSNFGFKDHADAGKVDGDSGTVNGDDGTSRILNGTDAGKYEYPSFVQIWRKKGRVCGGSVIDRDWIVTAAHCLVASNGEIRDLKEYKFIVGEGYYNEDGDVGVQFLNATQTFVHHKWKYVFPSSC